MTSGGSILFSLQSKLIFAFVAVVLVALMLASSVFVFVRRGDQERHELDRVIASSPAIYVRFSILRERAVRPSQLAAFVDEAAEGFDVRILIVDRRQGEVIADSEDMLTGQRLVLPRELSVSEPAHFPPYISWEPEKGTPGSGLVLVAPAIERFSPLFPQQNQQFRLLLAVPESTIAGAWQGLLPALGVAAAIALPIAALLAVIVARYITRPLQQLTVASQRMAEGNFDVDVSIDRRDEVGRLGQAFSTMALRVGEAHEQMRALVTNVSHDLKTPLTSILGFSQALRDRSDIDSAEAQRVGSVIHDEALRLNARLNDLLYLSELESGQAILERDEIDLHKLVTDVTRRIEAASPDLRLSADLANDLTVRADGAKLERALENLLDNARKYTPSEGEVSVRTFAEAGDAVIEVRNPAPEMSSEELPRLFERFYRRDQARGGRDQTRRTPGGSGLGLPIARDLIELHGGTLAASLSGGEIVFTIRLPILSGENEPDGA
ncbi:MAG: HAMP domain-containing histidine kinase [Chloroflexi bacterium]|nr:HAMP domain-containing histidine kinase [Chloroflexota bacterium]